MTEEEKELQEKLAETEAEKEMFKAHPINFVICKTFRNILQLILSLGTIAIIAQCSCDCILK